MENIFRARLTKMRMNEWMNECLDVLLLKWEMMPSENYRMMIWSVRLICVPYYWFGTTFCVSGSVGDSESLHDVGW